PYSTRHSFPTRRSSDLILYFWQLHELNNGGWIAAMVFAISGGLRLARFNATIDDPNKPPFAANYFTGVPAPAGAILALLPVYLRSEEHTSELQSRGHLV